MSAGCLPNFSIQIQGLQGHFPHFSPLFKVIFCFSWLFSRSTVGRKLTISVRPISLHYHLKISNKCQTNSILPTTIFWVLMLWNAPERRILTDCWGILSPWLKEILSFTAMKYSRTKDFQWLLGNNFTMVEGKFEFDCSEILQNEGFSMIVGQYFHHGWRKFWVLLLWNAPDWNISNDCWGTLSPWLTKILSFTAPECYRIKNDFSVVAQKGLLSGFLGFSGF